LGRSRSRSRRPEELLDQPGDLLQAAEAKGLIALDYDPSRGNFQVRLGAQ